LQTVVEYFKPRRIILFGSRARADTRETSDHDLLVVVDDDIPAEKLHWRSLYEARRRYRKAVDIVAYRQSTYNDQAGVIGTLPHMAATEGVVVYDRAHRAHAAEQARGRHRELSCRPERSEGPYRRLVRCTLQLLATRSFATLRMTGEGRQSSIKSRALRPWDWTARGRNETEAILDRS